MITRFGLFLTIVATVVLGAVPASKAQATEYKIFFISNSNENECNQVFSINPDGTNVKQLTNEQYCVDGNTFDVSSDGSLVTYTSNGQLLVVAADGENRQVLFDAADYLTDGYAIIRTESPQFSEDGALIVFFWDFPNQHVSLVELETGKLNDLAIYPNNQLPARAEFSPDGSMIALSRGCDKDNNTSSLLSLDVINVATSKIENIEDCSSEYWPVWQGDRAVTVPNPYDPPIPVHIDWNDGSLVLFSDDKIIYGKSGVSWVMLLRVEVRSIPE